MKSYVYILTNRSNKTLYIGVTKNLGRRITEHKAEVVEGFTSKYKMKKLIYFEEFDSLMQAVAREKQLKSWRREWKLSFIKEHNPSFSDLAE